MRLTDQEFENEKRYQGLMHFVRQMLEQGLITKAEYLSICKDYASRLSPKTGSLLPINDLLCVQNRVMNGIGKEVTSLEDNKD